MQRNLSNSILKTMMSARSVMQQCLSAKLMVKPEEDGSSAKYVEINTGVVIFICFLKEASLENIPKIVKSVLEVKLSPYGDTQKRLSILNLPGDILIVPQATLGGKMKGKVVHLGTTHYNFFNIMQKALRMDTLKIAERYHNNVAKGLGKELYAEFVKQAQEVFDVNKQKCPNECKIHHGTYGNLQVLTMQTNGPYTHIIES